MPTLYLRRKYYFSSRDYPGLTHILAPFSLNSRHTLRHTQAHTDNDFISLGLQQLSDPDVEMFVSSIILLAMVGEDAYASNFYLIAPTPCSHSV